MKKKVLSILTCVFLFGTIIVSYAAGETGNWTMVGDDYFTKLPIQSENPLLIKHLQDRDYIEIEDALVDTSVTPMSQEAMTVFSSDPDAVMVDNLLPNGKYLESNWKELQGDLIDSKMESKFLKKEAKAESKGFVVTIETPNGKEKVKMKKVESGGTSILIPNDPDNVPSDFIITPDGKKSFLASEFGIWLISDNKAIKVSKDTYDSLSYEELANQSVELYDENVVTWNDNVLSDPTSTKLSYVSNKHNIKENRNALFVYDMEKDTETLIKESSDFDYMDKGWLDNSNILCLKLNDKELEYVAVGLDGKEVPLNLKGEEPFVYSVQNGLIAFAEYLDSENIHIAKFTGTSDLEEIKNATFGFGTRLRIGINGFNPDNTKFACIYIPDESQKTRYVQVIDLENDTITNIDSLPSSSDYIVEFSWVDENTLLIVTGKNKKDITEESTWIYTLDGGENND